jgi:hypothetical protein
MRIRRNSASSGQGVALILPWLLAIAGVVFCLYAWLRQSTETDVIAPRGPEDPKAASALRRALASSRAENLALRQELDRLFGSPGARRAEASSKPTAEETQTTTDAESEAHRLDVAKRLQDGLGQLSTADNASRAAAGRVVWEALGLKDGAFPTLRDTYQKITDPMGRAILAGSMYFSRAPEVRDFLAEQALQEKDPMLHHVLVTQAANYVTPDGDNRLESTFLEALGASQDVDLRVAGVRGLRYGQGEAVSAALVKAASDPDEQVRLAAIDVLSARPDLRGSLSDIVSRDASPHVREVGNCRLLIAQEGQNLK